MNTETNRVAEYTDHIHYVIVAESECRMHNFKLSNMKPLKAVLMLAGR